MKRAEAKNRLLCRLEAAAFVFIIYKLSIDFTLQTFMMEENGTRLKEAVTWRT